MLTRMIAALVKKLIEAKYAGRTGNPDLGQVFYNDAFPRDELAKIKDLYNIPGSSV
jgi:hypothetical protein